MHTYCSHTSFHLYSFTFFSTASPEDTSDSVKESQAKSRGTDLVPSVCVCTVALIVSWRDGIEVHAVDDGKLTQVLSEPTRGHFDHKVCVSYNTCLHLTQIFVVKLSYVLSLSS